MVMFSNIELFVRARGIHVAPSVRQGQADSLSAVLLAMGKGTDGLKEGRRKTRRAAQLMCISLLPWKTKSIWIPCRTRKNIPHAPLATHTPWRASPLGEWDRLSSTRALPAHCWGCIFSTSLLAGPFLMPPFNRKFGFLLSPRHFPIFSQHPCPSSEKWGQTEPAPGTFQARGFSRNKACPLAICTPRHLLHVVRGTPGPCQEESDLSESSVHCLASVVRAAQGLGSGHSEAHAPKWSQVESISQDPRLECTGQHSGNQQ